MRLGATSLHRPENLTELITFVERLDVYGLSTVVAPLRLDEMSATKRSSTESTLRHSTSWSARPTTS
jgi:hypothetical protein